MTLLSLAALAFLPAAPAAAAPTDFPAAALEARGVLEELVAADTSNPPGSEARAVDIGAKRLKERGIPFEVTEFAPGRKNLTARLPGSGKEKPLLLLAHTDVVGADGQDWESDPHKLVEKDDYLIGRGVLDDLSMAAVELQVFLLLHSSKVRLRRDVILAWTGDEESGGLGVLHLLKEKPRSLEAGLALNEGGGPVLGEDGGVRFVDLQVAEKVYQDFELTASGKTGHSSVPLEDNAIVRLSRALERAGSARFPARLLRVGFVGELGYEIHVPASQGEALWDALMAAGGPQGIRTFGVEAQRVLR
ncbi:MAG: M20/M25/M40 family metallo-hydrolase, partial [Elusimicrobiota bacterium]